MKKKRNTLLAEKVAKWAIKEACEKTTTGSYSVYDYEIADYIDSLKLDWLNVSSLKWFDENVKLIKEFCDIQEETIGETWYEVDEYEEVNGLDLCLGLAYCPNAEEGEDES